MDEHNSNKVQIEIGIGWFVIIAILIAFVLGLVVSAHADDDQDQDRSTAVTSLPFVRDYVNPNVHEYGTVRDVYTLHPKDGVTWTAIVFTPILTPMLYREALIFCGDMRDRFGAVNDDHYMLLVYSRSISVARKAKGQIEACHELKLVKMEEK